MGKTGLRPIWSSCSQLDWSEWRALGFFFFPSAVTCVAALLSTDERVFRSVFKKYIALDITGLKEHQFSQVGAFLAETLSSRGGQSSRGGLVRSLIRDSSGHGENAS